MDYIEATILLTGTLLLCIGFLGQIFLTGKEADKFLDKGKKK
jgi:hypothetical protein